MIYPRTCLYFSSFDCASVEQSSFTTFRARPLHNTSRSAGISWTPISSAVPWLVKASGTPNPQNILPSRLSIVHLSNNHHLPPSGLGHYTKPPCRTPGRQGTEVEEMLVYLNDNLDYRLAAMQLASQYVSLLELQFPDGLALYPRTCLYFSSFDCASVEQSSFTTFRARPLHQASVSNHGHRSLQPSHGWSRLLVHQTHRISCHRACRIIFV
jgi:hypothetical protein